MRASGKLIGLLCISAFLLSCVSEPSEREVPEEGSAAFEGNAEPSEKSEEAPAQYVVTEDVYKKTFAEIEVLISRLNEIIKEKNFEEWVTYLSPEYVAKTGSAEFLKSASESAIIKKERIALKSLKDYFFNVVVPSRLQATLDDIVFLDAARVKAMTVINGNPVILYLLVKTDSGWMVGIW